MIQTLPVEITTDGSCYPNPGPGGWAAVFRYGSHLKVIYGFEDPSTNSRMELTAAIKALNYLKRPCLVKMNCDSQYVINGITKWIHGWSKNGWMTKPWKNNPAKPVTNRDLWELLVVAARRHSIQWNWVRGHDVHQDNILCDRYAGEARSTRKEGLLVLASPPATTKLDITRSIDFTNM